MKKYYKFKNKDGSLSIWYYDKDLDFDYGESTTSIPWWVYYPKTKTIDYCNMHHVVLSDIAEEFIPSFKKRLNEIHSVFKNDGMIRNIKL